MYRHVSGERFDFVKSDLVCGSRWQKVVLLKKKKKMFGQ